MSVSLPKLKNKILVIVSGRGNTNNILLSPFDSTILLSPIFAHFTTQSTSKTLLFPMIMTLALSPPSLLWNEWSRGKCKVYNFQNNEVKNIPINDLNLLFDYIVLPNNDWTRCSQYLSPRMDDCSCPYGDVTLKLTLATDNGPGSYFNTGKDITN